MLILLGPGDMIMGSASYFRRLPPEIRETILEYLDEQDGVSPVSVASVVHLLGERHLHVELAETSLKSSIAEAAIKRGFNVAFDGT
jgi:hypothetical protein